MALYFLKEEKNSPKSPSTTPPLHQSGHGARRILLGMGILAIVLATGIEALGFLRPSEIRLASLIRITPPVRTKTVFLSLPQVAEGADSMDTTLVLRGLSMLHPSLILLAEDHQESGDAARLLKSVKDHLHEQGIVLVEASNPSPESLWHPVPLCRYLPPYLGKLKGALPMIQGKAPAEGVFRFLEPPGKDPGSLPLLAVTESGEIASTLWWEGLMMDQPNAPVWLLANRLLLMPNHAAIPSCSGGIPIPHDLTLPKSVSSDDFLLRMEERERGNLSPDFDSLWEGALVVVGPPSLLPMTSALETLRNMTALGALTLVWQGATLLLLIIMLVGVFCLQRGPALVLIALLLGAGISGCWWSLRQGVLPPIAPWITALAFSVAGLVTANRPHTP